MKMEDVRVGQRVRERDMGEVGEVLKIEDGMVWVRLAPVNGVEQSLDIDPLDLDAMADDG